MTDKTTKLQRHMSRQGLSEEEVISALKSGATKKIRSTRGRVSISKNSFRYLLFSDAHIGHNKFHPELFDFMVQYTKQEKPDFIVNPGDHLEGMSGRPGHIYELSHIGFQQQIDYAAQLYSELDRFDHFGIDGNHDQWYEKKNNGGLIVGDELEARVKNYHNLGQDEGDIDASGIHIKLIHPGDGIAYALSYKLQKRIESLSGGEKPHILHSGHYHKSLYLYNRGVHGTESGTLCGQTKFMRAKGTPAHTGFWDCTVFHTKDGVQSYIPKWVPWFERGNIA